MNGAVLTKMPAFASRGGRWVTLDRRRAAGDGVAAFVSRPNCRDVVHIVLDATHAVTVTVTTEGLTSAFADDWTEPAGFVSMWLTDGEYGREWLVVEFDGGEHADLVLQFDAEQVGAFLAEVALERCRDAVAAGGAS
jgi:hypothetical protein